MRLFIPDIGQEFRLAEDWTFLLMNEGRNTDLWEAMNFENHPDVKAHNEYIQDIHDQIRDKDARMRRWVTAWLDAQPKVKAVLPFSGYFNGNGSGKPFMDGFHEYCKLPEGEHYQKLLEEQRAIQVLKMSVTIPKDSVLKVDRVYIRKGANDFSSITFWLSDSPDDRLRKPRNKKDTTAKLQRKIRFWAHLTDVNRIEFVDE